MLLLPAFDSGKIVGYRQETYKKVVHLVTGKRCKDVFYAPPRWAYSNQLSVCQSDCLSKIFMSAQYRCHFLRDFVITWQKCQTQEDDKYLFDNYKIYLLDMTSGGHMSV